MDFPFMLWARIIAGVFTLNSHAYSFIVKTSEIMWSDAFLIYWQYTERDKEKNNGHS